MWLHDKVMTSVLPMLSAGGWDRAILQHKLTRHTMKERVEQMAKALQSCICTISTPHLWIGQSCSCIISRDWKIGKYRRYFEEISDIGQHRNDNRHRLSIDGKIGKKSAKSSIYRRNIGEAPIYRRKIASGLTRGAIGGEFKKNRRKYRRYFGIFTDFSKNFPIFPTNPARTHRIQNLAQKSWI